MNDQAVGPVTMEDLLSLRSSGVIDDQTLVWTESQGDWQALATVMPQNQRVETPKSSMSARTGPLSYSPGEASREAEVEPQLRAKNYSSLAGGLPSSQSPFAHGAITAPLARNESFSPANAPAYLGGGGGSGGGGFPSAATAPLGRLEPVREPEPTLRQQHSGVEAQPVLGFTQQPGPVVTAPAPAPGLEYGVSLPHICEECRTSQLEEDMLRYQDYWICSACKPRFAVKLQEGSFRRARLNYGAVITRFGCTFADRLVMMCVTLPLAFGAEAIDFERTLSHVHDPGLPIFTYMAGLFNMLFQVFYYFIFMWLMGCTPGQAYFGTRIVRPDGSPLTVGRVFGWSACNLLIAIMADLPVLAAIWDPEKRTLQDTICNTRFIYKRD